MSAGSTTNALATPHRSASTLSRNGAPIAAMPTSTCTRAAARPLSSGAAAMHRPSVSG